MYSNVQFSAPEFDRELQDYEIKPLEIILKKLLPKARKRLLRMF